MGACISVMSNLMYFSEKFTMCLAATTVLTCLVLTFIMMLGLGIGLGYNYCFVDIKTKHRYVPGQYRYKVLEATTMWRTPAWRRLPTTRPTTTRPPTTTTKPAGRMHQDENTEQLIDYKPPSLDEFSEINSKIDGSEIETNDGSKTEPETTIETEYPEKNENPDQTENTLTSTTSKTVLQIQGLDLIALLSKLKSENRNYTLQIVTS